MITRRDAPPSIDLDNESVFDSEVPRTTINDRDPEWLFEIPNRITPMAMLPGELASQSRHFCFDARNVASRRSGIQHGG